MINFRSNVLAIMLNIKMSVWTFIGKILVVGMAQCKFEFHTLNT